MLLVEIFERNQLTENKIRKAIMAGTLAASLMPSQITPSSQLDIDPKIKAQYKHQLDLRILANIISAKYKVSKQFAQHVVALAEKYARPTFPTRADILAIIGIESNFKPTAVSKLHRDPAVGLMQIRPKMHKLDPNYLKLNIGTQIGVGSAILSKNYQILGSKEAAVHAYNVGVKNYLTGDRVNPEYVEKYNKELQLYKNE